jgi:hypothetical protein
MFDRQLSLDVVVQSRSEALTAPSKTSEDALPLGQPLVEAVGRLYGGNRDQTVDKPG